MEERPDDLKENEKDVRKLLTGKSTGDYRDMKEAQKHMWDTMTARMDHADKQSAKNFAKLAEHLKDQAELAAKKEAKDSRKHNIVKGEMLALDGNLSALDVGVKSVQFGMGVL